MTMPPATGVPDGGLQAAEAGIVAQLLVAIGELKTSVAVLDTKLTSMTDNQNRLLDDDKDREKRIRDLERTAAEDHGGRDTWARVFAGLAVLGAVGSFIGSYLHH